MLSALMLAAAITGPSSGTPPDPLASAIEHFRTVESYRVTIYSTHADGEEYIRYYYKKPGFVRMEFIRPHAGALLIYNPATRRVRVWPFGTEHFAELNLSPGNPLIQSLSGMRVDQSDVGVLLENIRILREGGSIEVLGEESMEGRTALHLIVTGRGGFAVANVHRSELWLDTASQFPVKVISRDLRNVIIESVIMDELEINATLPETLFNP